MKLSAGLIAAISGCAAAVQQSAEVFIVPSNDALSPPAVTPSLARLLLLQRVAPNGQSLSSNDIPNGVAIDRAISFINRFGRATPPLFSDDDGSEPNQLLLMLDSMNDKQFKDFRKALGLKPSFTVTDPPADQAHRDLVELDFYRAGVADANKCTIQQVVNPLDDCWNGKHSAVAKYSVSKNPEILNEVPKHLKQLLQLAESGDLQTTILVLPSSKSSSNWGDEQQQELRRRRLEEHVMAQADESGRTSTTGQPSAPQPTTPAPKPDKDFYKSLKKLPSCFQSESECNDATRHCSGHGECKNRFAGADGMSTTKDKSVCFSCHCLETRSKSGSIMHWGGPACAKKDVSVAFWLFAGFTLLMIAILTMSISMLFNVGEEKLPGVIGAGVSRSK